MPGVAVVVEPVAPFDHVTSPLQPVAVNVAVPAGQTVVAHTTAGAKGLGLKLTVACVVVVVPH